MSQKKWPVTFVFVVVMILVAGSGVGKAQLSKTTSFLANVSNQYRERCLRRNGLSRSFSWW